MKQIYVRSEDFGVFTQEEVPVVRRDADNEITYCTHGGATLEEIQQQYDRIDEPDITWTDRLLICRACKAWKLEGENDWHDSPIEGRHYE